MKGERGGQTKKKPLNNDHLQHLLKPFVPFMHSHFASSYSLNPQVRGKTKATQVKGTYLKEQQYLESFPFPLFLVSSERKKIYNAQAQTVLFRSAADFGMKINLFRKLVCLSRVSGGGNFLLLLYNLIFVAKTTQTHTKIRL